MKKTVWTIFLLLLFVSTQIHANSRKAPEWDIAEWINGQGVTVSELAGKVVIVEFFQLWCPGCKSFSLPLLARWENTFAREIADKRLVMLSIHTVFEGHDYQNTQRLREFLKERGIKRLVGVDRHRNGSEIPETMRRYRTRGTPEMAIIGKHGNIRFQHFGGFDPEPVEQFIHKLLDEPYQIGIK
ncbi:MAG: TlpA family protein disulfide reductase [Gammaproteobacteria bacterium]|nr:TlpA family protein disulfide reductase [Gammaproteobacteria bacterium]